MRGSDGGSSRAASCGRTQVGDGSRCNSQSTAPGRGSPSWPWWRRHTGADKGPEVQQGALHGAGGLCAKLQHRQAEKTMVQVKKGRASYIPL